MDPITKYINTIQTTGLISIIIKRLLFYIIPLILILMNLCISRVLVGFTLLSKIGVETLYLCGNEYILRNLVIFVISLTGLGIYTNNPMMSIIYSIFLIIIGHYILIPFEKKWLNKSKRTLKIIIILIINKG